VLEQLEREFSICQTGKGVRSSVLEEALGVYEDDLKYCFVFVLFK
jgi:hypothetical protein